MNTVNTVKYANQPYICRAEELARYLVEHRATVRSVAAHFGISKSTVHVDITKRLPYYNPSLYLQAKKILEENLAECHIRGGAATKEYYARRSRHS